MKIFIFIFLFLSNTAFAESPAKELIALTEQLQKNPANDALREKIIKLGLKFKPALPEEADKRMIRGEESFKTASNLTDYKTAAKEFEAATLSAPWYGDAYYNLGVAQDKAEDFDAALKSLKFASLASPKNKDAKKLSYAVEVRKEKKEAPEKQKIKDEAIVKSLERAVYTYKWTDGQENQFRITNGYAVVWEKRLLASVCLCGDESQCYGPLSEERVCSYSFALVGRHGQNQEMRGLATVDIAEDGKSLTYTLSDGQSKFIYNRR